MPIKISLKQLGLFSFLVALLVACKKPDDTIGDSLQPESDKLFAFQTDSFNLTASTFRRERSRIDLYANFLCGNYVDDVFGTVKCQAVFQLAPSNTSTPPQLDESNANQLIVLDSAVMRLSMQNEGYGKNTPMYFVLNKLVDEIDVNTDYYSDFVVHKESENLIFPGREWNHPKPENVTSIDSSAFLDIRLQDSFGEDLLKRAPLESFDVFKNYIHGFVLSSNTIDGRAISYRVFDTRLILYYHTTSSGPYSGGQQIDKQYELIVTSSCETFTKVDHNRYNTTLQALDQNLTIDGSEFCYAQQPGSSRIKVNIGDVLYLSEDPELVVNKAELIIPYDVEAKFQPLNRLVISTSKDESHYFGILDSAYAGGIVNTSLGYYKFNITRHVQALLDGESELTNLYLTDFPLIDATINTNSGLYNSMGTRRTLLHGPKYSLEDPRKNMRLVITYSY